MIKLIVDCLIEGKDRKNVSRETFYYDDEGDVKCYNLLTDFLTSRLMIQR